MNEIKSTEFSKFLFELLDPICDAEPHSLSEYIKELLVNGFNSKDHLSEVFQKDLEEFLHENTKPFIASLIKKLENLNYFNLLLKSNTSKKDNGDSSKNDYQMSGTDDDYNNSSSDDSDSDSDRERERERSYNHRRNSGRERERDRGDHYYNRSISRERHRERDRSRSKSPSGGGSTRKRSRSNDSLSRSRSRSNERNQSNHGFNSNRYNNNNNKYRDNRFKRRCKHFDETGKCPRGNLCTFIHSTEPFDPMQQQYHSNKRFNNSNNHFSGSDLPFPSNLPQNFNSYDPSQPPQPVVPPVYNVNDQPFLHQPNFNNSHHFNNTNNSNNMNGFDNLMNGNLNSNNSASNINDFPNLVDPTKRFGVDNNNNNNNNFNAHNNYNNNHPNYKQNHKTSSSCPDETATKLILTNIPIQSNNEDSIREHFMKFGTVVKIEKLSTSRCMVELSQNIDCVKAMKSPEAILNNRFIKLYWYLDNLDVEKKSKFEINQEKQEKIQKKKEEQEKKQQELLKIREQLLLQRLEYKKKLQLQTEQKKLDLQQQTKSNEQFRTQKIEERNHLMTKLSLEKDESEREIIKEKINQLTKSISESYQKETAKLNSLLKSSTPTPTPTKPVVPVVVNNNVQSNQNMEQLMSTLQNLESEAKSLGLETSNLPTTPTISALPTTPIPITPKPKPFVPKKSTVQNSTMIIDNRTTTIRINDPPQQFQNETVLKSLFSDISQFENHKDENYIQLTFAKRSSAEKVFVVAKTFKGKELDIKWVEKSNTNQNVDEDEKKVQDENDQPMNGIESDEEDDDENKERNWKH